MSSVLGPAPAALLGLFQQGGGSWDGCAGRSEFSPCPLTHRTRIVMFPSPVIPATQGLCLRWRWVDAYAGLVPPIPAFQKAACPPGRRPALRQPTAALHRFLIMPAGSATPPKHLPGEGAATTQKPRSEPLASSSKHCRQSCLSSAMGDRIVPVAIRRAGIAKLAGAGAGTMAGRGLDGWWASVAGAAKTQLTRSRSSRF